MHAVPTALSFPELPSLVPSRGLAGPVVGPAEPCESALPFSVGVWCGGDGGILRVERIEALTGPNTELGGCVNCLEADFSF